MPGFGIQSTRIFDKFDLLVSFANHALLVIGPCVFIIRCRNLAGPFRLVQHRFLRPRNVTSRLTLINPFTQGRRQLLLIRNTTSAALFAGILFDGQIRARPPIRLVIMLPQRTPPMPNGKAMTTATHFEHLDNNSAPDPRTIIVIAGLSVRNRRNSNFCDAVQDGNHHSAIVSNGVYCSVDNSGSQNAHNDWVEFYMM